MLIRPEPEVSAFDVLVLATPVGGSNTLATVLAELPDAPPVALLLGQHLGDDQALGELLRCQPRWPVQWMRNGTVLEAGRLYVGLPGTSPEVEQELRCRVTPPERDEGSQPLDRLLTSLAHTGGPRVLTVILAGEGSDGVVGAKAVREAGGTVLVQTPDTAGATGLPSAVIAAEAATRVLPLHELGQVVTELLSGRSHDLRRERVQAGSWHAPSAASQAFLLTLSDALRPLADPVAIEEDACRRLGEHLRIDRAYYVEVDELAGVAQVRRDWVRDGAPSLAGTHRVADFGWSVDILRGGDCHVITDTQTSALVPDADRAASAALQIIACMGAPLIKAGRLVGALCVTAARPRVWRLEEVELLQEVGERIWSAIERARVETALTSSEAKYRTLFDSIEEGVTTVELLYSEDGEVADFVYLDHNPALTKQTGITSAVIGKKVSELYPNLEPVWFEVYGRVASTGVSERFEQYVTDLERWLEVYASRVGGAGSRILVVVYNDFTERKCAALNLAFLAEIDYLLAQLTTIDETVKALGSRIAQHFQVPWCMFSELREDTELAVVTYGWHAEGVPSLVGEYRMRDYLSDAQVARNNAGELTVCQDTQTDADVSAERYAALGVRSFVNVPLRRDGHWRFQMYIMDTRPRLWREDEIALMRDLTNRIWTRLERARAEDALRESEARFRTTANLVPDLLWESGPDGFTNWYNQRWLDYTGQTVDQAIGWGWLDAIHPDDRDTSAQQYRESVVAGLPLRREHRIRQDGGEYRWFVLQTAPLRNAHGQVTRVYGAATDIHVLRTLNTLLAAEVENHMQRLMDLNSELRTLATASAEELSEPLRRLRGFLHLLEQRVMDQLDEKTKRYLYLVQVDAQRAERLAESFKELAQLSRRDLTLSAVPLTPLVLQVRSDLAPRLIERKVTWSVGTLPVVQGDAMLLRQAFTELIHHGFQLVPAGFPAHIEVADGLPGSGATVQVTVAPVKVNASDLNTDGLATARRVMQRLGGLLEVAVHGEKLQVRIQLPT